MPNQVDARKEKFTYNEWKTVRAEIIKAAGEQKISETEMFRRIILAYANSRRRKQGQPIFGENGKLVKA